MFASEIEDNVLAIGLEQTVNLYVGIFVSGVTAVGPVYFDANVYLSSENDVYTREKTLVCMTYDCKLQ